MIDWTKPWPVMDPSIPDADQKRMAGNPAITLIAQPGGTSSSPSVRGCLLLIFGLPLVAIIIGVMVDFHPVLGSLTALALLAWPIVWFLSRPTPDQLTRQYRTRYVIPVDLDVEANQLLERARTACGRVLSSEVYGRGLFNAIANDVVLPGQLWEIARLLREHTTLRAEQNRAASGVVTPELMAVLEPQRRALGRSLDAVTQRIQALEAYAYRVQEADAALMAQELLQSNSRYQALLAQTDDLSAMNALQRDTDAAAEALGRSIRNAIDAGKALALPGEPHDDGMPLL